MEQREPPNAEELFLAVLERPRAERSSYLEVRCGTDPALRAEVEMLVACHEAAGDFLESPPATSIGAYMPQDPTTGAVPERVGNFRVERLLGAGGMGCVYLAESAEPRRTVALKVIRPGLGTPELIRRFRHEAQVVALLQHPGVAQLFEAGTEQSSLGPAPYFAMEYVDGPSITGFANERGLSPERRMELMARVAEAVHHAHQKGVIHRDLKPGNILVDRSGQPKVLDFGVARLIETDGATMHTAAGQLVGTLSYMSPEQLAGDPGSVDARSDIYSLGVILYELLAGKPPYDVRKASLVEALTAIRDTAPRRLGEIDRRLRGDPELIAQTALAKDPALRYQSASDLAADLRRCLRDEPIMARRPSAGYQLAKFARRNKVLVGLALAMLASLVGGLGVSVWQMRAADRARLEAQNRAVEAEENLGIAEGINSFIEDLFASAEPDRAKKPDLKVREVLDRSTVESIREKYPDSARLRMRLNGTIGRTYKELSMPEAAEPHLIEAAAIARASLPRGSRERFNALRDLGHLYKLQDRFDEGEEFLREATDAAGASYGPDSEITISCRNDLASLLLRRGKAPEAERLFAESVEASERVLGARHETTLVSLNNLSSAMKAAGKPAEAIEIRRRLVTLCEESLGEENHGTITSINNLAKDLLDEGRAAEAEPLLRRALSLRLKLQGPEHRSTLNTTCNLGSCVAALGRLDEAGEILAGVVRVAQGQIPHGNIDLAKYQQEYGMVLLAQGEHTPAAAQLRAAYEAFAGALGETSKAATGAARAVSEAYAGAGQTGEAEEWAQRARR